MTLSIPNAIKALLIMGTMKYACACALHPYQNNPIGQKRLLNTRTTVCIRAKIDFISLNAPMMITPAMVPALRPRKVRPAALVERP